MGNQVKMQAAPTIRTETMAIDELVRFLDGLYVSAHSTFIQMEQFKRWLGQTLAEHPAVAVAMAENKKVQQFINSVNEEAVG
ncbi:MAG TPA: hypothetical protein ENI05_11300 [Porticoccus sp.]|nr:hypothetical protein [Porticoccus sp.]